MKGIIAWVQTNLKILLVMNITQFSAKLNEIGQCMPLSSKIITYVLLVSFIPLKSV